MRIFAALSCLFAGVFSSAQSADILVNDLWQGCLLSSASWFVLLLKLQSAGIDHARPSVGSEIDLSGDPGADREVDPFSCSIRVQIRGPQVSPFMSVGGGLRVEELPAENTFE